MELIELTSRSFITAAPDGEMPIKMHKDGNGFEQPFVDLDSDIWPREGIVRIEILKKNQKTHANIKLTRYRDRKNDCFFGIVTGIDSETKQFRFASIGLQWQTVYDLSIPDERRKAIIIANCPFVEGSRNQKGKPLFKLVSQEEQALKYLSKYQKRKKSMEFAESLNANERVDFAYLIGFEPTVNSPAMIQQEIYKYADENPEKFIELFEDPRRNAMIVFQRAMKNGLIKSTPESGFTHEGISLGVTETQAVVKIVENPALLFKLDKASKDRVESTIRPGVKAKPVENKPVVTNDKDEEIRKLKEELAKLKEKENTEGETKEEISQSRIEELRFEAKQLGIKGFGIMKPEKLAKEIERAKGESQPEL